MKTKVLGLVAIFLSIATVNSARADDTQWKELTLKGKAALAANQFKQAQEHFLAAAVESVKQKLAAGLEGRQQ